MKENNQTFWRGFTWRRFILWSLFWFATTLIVALITDYFDPNAVMADDLKTINLLKKAVGSLIVGFLIAVWLEPGLDDKKKTQQP